MCGYVYPYVCPVYQQVHLYDIKLSRHQAIWLPVTLVNCFQCGYTFLLMTMSLSLLKIIIIMTMSLTDELLLSFICNGSIYFLFIVRIRRKVDRSAGDRRYCYVKHCQLGRWMPTLGHRVKCDLYQASE